MSEKSKGAGKYPVVSRYFWAGFKGVMREKNIRTQEPRDSRMKEWKNTGIQECKKRSQKSEVWSQKWIFAMFMGEKGLVDLG